MYRDQLLLLAIKYSGFELVDGMWKPPFPDTIGRRRRRRHMPDFFDIGEQIKWLTPHLKNEWKYHIKTADIIIPGGAKWLAVATNGQVGFLFGGDTIGEATLEMFVCLLGYERGEYIYETNSAKEIYEIAVEENNKTITINA